MNDDEEEWTVRWLRWKVEGPPEHRARKDADGAYFRLLRNQKDKV